MPRKQRFKPSRKPKPITPTEDITVGGGTVGGGVMGEHVFEDNVMNPREPTEQPEERRNQTSPD